MQTRTVKSLLSPFTHNLLPKQQLSGLVWLASKHAGRLHKVQPSYFWLYPLHPSGVPANCILLRCRLSHLPEQAYQFQGAISTEGISTSASFWHQASTDNNRSWYHQHITWILLTVSPVRVTLSTVSMYPCTVSNTRQVQSVLKDHQTCPECFQNGHSLEAGGNQVQSSSSSIFVAAIFRPQMQELFI